MNEAIELAARGLKGLELAFAALRKISEGKCTYLDDNGDSMCKATSIPCHTCTARFAITDIEKAIMP